MIAGGLAHEAEDVVTEVGTRPREHGLLTPYPFTSSHLVPKGIVTGLIHTHLRAHPFRSVPKDSQIERGIIVGERGRRHGTIGRREGALAADTGPLR